MQPHAVEYRHLERQIAYGRVIFLLLALADLLRQAPPDRSLQAAVLLLVYLGLALAFLFLQRTPQFGDMRAPLAVDLVVLGLLITLGRPVMAFVFVYMYVALAAGIRWGLERSTIVAGGVTLTVLSRASLQPNFDWLAVLSWGGLVAGTCTAGVGLAYLGDQYRRHTSEYELMARVIEMLQVERGTAESLRLVLDELARAFHCEKALLVFRDADLERVFLWTVSVGQERRITPESMPLARADWFLLGQPEATVCWNEMTGTSRGFGWDRLNSRRLPQLPRMPDEAQQELGLRSMMSVTLDFNGQPVGRMMLCNARRSWSRQDLQWFERVVRHLGPPLDNLFLLRHIRARAIEGERSRISREIHDGILQTLLSVDIQLDVLRRKVQQTPEVAAGLGTLQQTVRGETAELRRMVTDMRPIGVESADLAELMQGFAERFRNESGLALDLLVDTVALQAPDRVCRDLFQIYREALHNVKKHAHATHVVVKLWQNETQVTLMIDDNGKGFSFAGRFTGDALERLRLGPISIKERARSLGGVLTVESTPGHGARLTVEVPLA
jgi:signal transduction histidine kinase